MTRTSLSPSLSVRRILTGLWQMADQERDGKSLDLDVAAEALADYARAGFDTFDMADHYGSAEIVAGKATRLLEAEGRPAPVILTKWCPPPGPMDKATVREGVETAIERLGRPADLMQFHWWRYASPEYLDALHHLQELREEGLFGGIGLTNFDAQHVDLVRKCGIEVVSNQVCFSLLDRRAAGPLSKVAETHGVKLLAFGTLCGGFLSDRWLNQPEPSEIPDWSRMKYKRFVDASGGWAPFQGLLRALRAVADRHDASIANVATRWVLDHPAVAGVIVGARLGETQHREDNARMEALDLSPDDHALIDAATEALTPIPGDCGDEYRKPPFLTASGDLSHHLDALPPVFRTSPVPARPDRTRADSGSEWEPKAGFSRGIRAGDRILVSGTTATDPHGNPVCPGDPGAQAVYILDKIVATVISLGGQAEDIVRTRIYMTDPSQWEPVGAAHARVFGEALPANTLIGTSNLVGPYAVEIEAEAWLGPDRS